MRLRGEQIPQVVFNNTNSSSGVRAIILDFGEVSAHTLPSLLKKRLDSPEPFYRTISGLTASSIQKSSDSPSISDVLVLRDVVWVVIGQIV